MEIHNFFVGGFLLMIAIGCWATLIAKRGELERVAKRRLIMVSIIWTIGVIVSLL